ncbi:MAG: protein kinase [Myxococcota bacterium]
MSSCLTLADFERVSAGLADKRAQRSFRNHLDHCDACRVAYERFEKDQAFLAGAKRALSDDSDDDGGIETVATGKTGKTGKAKGLTPQIDGYRISGVLGQGGMGIVYRAVQTKLNRTVALKVLPAMVGAASPSAVSRFRREAMAAARLHHTNIVPIYDFGESFDAYYYAMELISGRALNAVIKRFAEQQAATASPAQLSEMLLTMASGVRAGTPPSAAVGSAIADPPSMMTASSGGRGRLYYRRVARWMADVADALHYAHAEGIIHRDVKPANLILADDGRIMVADFGLAKSTDEESMTLTGSLLGTVRYLSPEQAMARRIPVDHRTDIYSLGATMYELLCFQPAFPGTDDKQVLSAVITRDPAPPHRIAPSVPREMETICLKAMEKSPEFRYATARAFADDLRRYTQDRPIVARRPGPIARARKFIRRHKVAVAAAIVILAVVSVSVVTLKEEREQKIQAAANAQEERDQRFHREDEKRIAERQLSIMMGLRAQEARRWEEAESRFREALVGDTRGGAAAANLARLFVNRYNYDPQRAGDPALLEEAMRFCEQALAQTDRDDEQYGTLKNIKGGLLKMMGRYAEAAAFYQQAIAHREENDFAWENLGVIHALAGRFDEAVRCLQRSTELIGTDQDCESPWRNLASLLLFRGTDEAAGAIETALVCKSDDPWSTLIRARLRLGLDDQGDPRGAWADADYAKRKTDQCGVVYGRLAGRLFALAELRSGRLARARELALKAIEAGDMESINQFIIALAEARSGNFAAAEAAADRAVGAWPADLTDPGAYRVIAPEGVLWFETAAELHGLQDEVRRLVTVGGR